MTWTAPDVSGEPTLRTGTERELLDTWLDMHRRTLLWKCAGLTEQQLKTAADPPSTLSLLGLVRHMADNERWWFSHHAAGLPLVELYCTDAEPDADLDDIATADAAADLATFSAEVAASRAATAGLDLDSEVTGPSGRPIGVRWIFLHMIEEYARHNGHADFLREQLDGRTGDFPPAPAA
jgi:hypothetical protein